MNIVPNLESSPNWRQRADASVGGNHPDDFGMNLVQADPEREFYIIGPAYSDGLFSLFTPIMPNTGKLALQLEYKIDQDTVNDAQALEFDSRMVIARMGRNWSSQFNYQQGGVWQGFRINPTSGKGEWFSTAFKPGKFIPDVWHKITLSYSFDATTYSYESVQVDNLPLFICPPELKKLPNTPLLWADGVNLQIQLDMNYKAGAYKTRMRRGSYIWS